MTNHQQFVDMLGRSITLDFPPKRIISLVPSITELLFDLGLGDKIVGCTKFCVHPASSVHSINKIGGTKKFNLDLIFSLKADLIIANKEENEQADVERLAESTAVWVSEVTTFDAAILMIDQIGTITDTVTKAKELSNSLLKRKEYAADYSKKTALYFIWRKPYMVAGKDTFINSMLGLAGFQNILAQNRYPVMNNEELMQLNPELVLLSSEPYPFKEQHKEEIMQLFPNSKIAIVDGEYFSWYGSRMKGAFDYFNLLRAKIN